MRPIQLRIFDPCPDGVTFKIDWDNFPVGASVFIPAINTELLKKQLREIERRKGWKGNTHCRIEAGKWGLRYWRLL